MASFGNGFPEFTMAYFSKPTDRMKWIDVNGIGICEMNLIHNLTIKSVSNTADDDPNNKSLDFHTGTESVCVD